jgi:hypothetical protein
MKCMGTVFPDLPKALCNDLKLVQSFSSLCRNRAKNAMATEDGAAAASVVCAFLCGGAEVPLFVASWEEPLQQHQQHAASSSWVKEELPSYVVDDGNKTDGLVACMNLSIAKRGGQ